MQGSALLRNSALALACSALFAGNAVAQTPAPAAAPPTPEHTITANVGLFSQYVFRGIAQTAGKPAVQGGFDYAHSSGFYAGTWGSNISWLEDFGAYTKSSLEWDFYGGYKNTFPGQDDWNYDVGTLFYYYPGSRITDNPNFTSANTWEIYGAIGWKWLSVKASYNLKDYFGTPDSDGSWYFDLSGTYPIGDTGWALVGHVGRARVNRTSIASYTDWKAGFSYTVPDGVLKGIEFGAYYTGNNANEAFYTDLNGYNTGKDTGVAYVKKTF
jgi:uncharacterized protein (TIGR02001 family)